MPPKKKTKGSPSKAPEPMEVQESTEKEDEQPVPTANRPFNPEDYGEIEIPEAPQTVATYEINGPRLMITKIVNENFKSYAGVRSLGPFHKSFTSIVGPNGSGKSNVIDSMLFVFGYRASKVRLKKLSGLIHNSENHKNIESCTVTVYFQSIIDTGSEDDEYTVVPDSEFRVSRTAFKDNSSNYSVNGKRTTYKEVGLLLRGKGIDLDHNRFLILQGEVEQIAMMKPKAMTEHEDGILEFLEDIIGSNRFKEPIATLTRRVETLNELRGEKMNRVKAVEKDKDDLEDAKNEAVEFLTLQNDIVRKKNRLFQKYISSCESREAKATEELTEIKKGMEEFDAKMKTIADTKEEKTKRHKKILKAYDDLTKQCEENKEKFSEMEKADVKLREDLKHAKSKAKKLEKNVEQENKKIDELKQIPEQAEKSIEDMRKKQERLEKEKQKEEEKLKLVLESLKTETKGLQEQKDKKEEKLLGMQKSVNETKSRLEVSQSELDLYLSNQKKETSKLNEMTRKLEKVQENLAERTKTMSEMQKSLPQLEKALNKSLTMSEMQKSLPQLEKALDKSLKDLDETAQREQGIAEEVRSVRRRVEEARSALESNKSRGKVIEFIMNLKKSGTLPGVYGRLGDLGGIDNKYDVAISTACGALDNIVVDTIDTAQKCVEFLKKNNVGSATFIGLDKMARWKSHSNNKIKTPENVPRLFDLVKVDNSEIRPAFYFALRDTLVANDLDQATRIAYGAQRFRVVTVQGALIDTSGTMSGGGKSVCKGRMGSQAVSDVDTKDLANNETKLKQLSDSSQQCRVNKEKLEDAVKQQKKDLQHVQHNMQKAEMEIKACTEQTNTLTSLIKDQEERVKAAAPDEKQLKEMEKKVAEYRKDYQKVADVANKLEEEVQVLHNEIMDIGGSKMTAAQKRVDVIQTQIDQVTGQITKATVGVKTSERNLKKAQDKVVSLKEEIEDNKEDVKKLEQSLSDMEEEATQILTAYQESQDTMKAAETSLHEVQKDLEKLEEEETKLQKGVIDVKNELDKVENVIKENQQKARHYKKEITGLALNPIDGREVDALTTVPAEELAGVSREDVQQEILVIEEQLAQMKPNMAAIAEYRKKEELYMQRVAELDQITEFRDKQRQYFEDLRKQRLSEFMAGFSVITYKLKEMYQMITLGGDAELELVDSLDPFSEGIVFSVRPPKKSWKNISNLSGGEKTLSSLALVFALHHYKPTPLYVMDEIDAALDFKNVSIVAHYIKERTKNAQFIIISLRNNMFELADRLVGIYKTDNCTKSVAINPNKLAIPQGALQELATNTITANMAAANVTSMAAGAGANVTAAGNMTAANITVAASS